jgi:hypothetical protein
MHDAYVEDDGITFVLHIVPTTPFDVHTVSEMRAPNKRIPKSIMNRSKSIMNRTKILRIDPNSYEPYQKKVNIRVREIPLLHFGLLEEAKYRNFFVVVCR